MFYSFYFLQNISVHLNLNKNNFYVFSVLTNTCKGLLYQNNNTQCIV